jgi:hypothetical protein
MGGEMLRIGDIGVIGLIGVILLVAVPVPVFGEGGMVMKDSDWLHLVIPGTCYVGGAQIAETMGIRREVAEWGLIGLGTMAIIGGEYYDFFNSGSATKEDMELGFTSLAVGWVINKAVNECFRRTEDDRPRMKRIERMVADKRGN